jgi:hypothetical protein
MADAIAVLFSLAALAYAARTRARLLDLEREFRALRAWVRGVKE